MLTCNILNDTRTVLLDPRTPDVGGSFWYSSGVLQPYSPLPLRWVFDQLIRYPHAVMLDVGASTGSFSLLSAHHPDLEVWAFEPVPLTNRILTENIYLNNLTDKVHISPCGVSFYNGTGVMNVIRDIGGLGVSILDGTPRADKVCDPVMIDVVTLDTFCALRDIHPTLLKIDTEGAEKLVLKGASETIERYKPFMLIEYSQENANQYGYAVNELVQMVEAWGYTWVCPEGLDLWCVPAGWEELHH